ncbi:protein UNUSUAL FLORAL ORGANS [Sesamum indicum]|uniref:Protein UNUSUAL FLORAL ORGANS n=1 Tax=Sesamum indicum TaxID=4182 RepID=A0A6I9UQ89_SESIN|nr:protein UNUSUAL FLORAL ORGANS [Sesamum indicum]
MEPFHTPTSIPISYAFTSIPTAASICGSTDCISISPWMDCRIWSRLPQGLIDRIVACLSPPAFFRARAVCKRWYGLIFSNTFLELYLQVSSHRHWFLFFKQKSLKSYIYRNNTSANNGTLRANYEGYLFDPESLKWYRISFPLIPPAFSPASSSGGLICWVSDDAGSKSILLCNPLIGSLIQLPSTLRPRLCPSIGLTITNSSIDLAFAGDDLISPYAVKNLSSESFHVDGGGFYSIWGTIASLPRLCSFESGRMVHVEGRFYCMNYSPFSVLAYDISINQWSKIQAPMRRFLRSPSLVESRGKLLLVAAVEKSKLNVPRSLRLWALQECGNLWVEIERMPQQLYNQFAEVEGGHGFNCVAHGEFVVILIKGSDKALLLDFIGKRWVWIPPCPYINNGGCGGRREDAVDELHGFAYEPRLAIPITALLEQLTLPFNSFTA